MTYDKNIEPCPFCKKRMGILHQAYWITAWAVRCDAVNCEAYGPSRRTRLMAKNAWNKAAKR